MSCPTCSHRKADGILCGSPALHGKKLCYFHQRDHRRQANIAQLLRRTDPLNPHSSLPKTLPGIQVALYEVMTAVADGRINPKRAGVILFSLQQKSLSLRQPYPA